SVVNNKIAVQYINRETHLESPPDDAHQEKSINTQIAMIGGDPGRWQLLVTHRAGSLDAAVASVRRRNLVMSFSVLMLLSISVALIVITTRRAARLATQQMEFVAGVSHELRTPLAVIRSAAENLADGVIEDRSGVKQYGELIEREGKRLSAMVEQTLEFAGIQSGKRSYTMQSVAVTDVIEDAMVLSKTLLEEERVELQLSVASEMPPVKADRAALARAIQNLISNAAKYCGDHRLIRMTASVDLSSSPSSVAI